MRFTLDTDLRVVERVEWDGDAARERILRWAGYDDAETDEQRDAALNRASRLFLFRRDEAISINDLVAPCGDIEDGEPALVTSGMRAALAAVNGARGGIDAPDDLLDQARAALERLLERDEKTIYEAKHLTIKQASDGRIIARGYAIVWDSTDLEGERFTRETDLGESLLGLKAYPLLYEHGMNHQIGAELIGRVVKTARDEIGLLIEAELERHTRYIELVRALAERDALGMSTGAVAHLVKREGRVIKTWPIVEVSLTPTPAEPKTLGVELAREIARKSGASIPEAERDEAEDAAREAELRVNDEARKTKEEGLIMIATQINEIKTLGDFIRAVKTGEAKALSMTTGALGGYLVPDTLVADLLRMASEDSIVLPRAFVVRTSGTVRQPTIDVSKGGTDTLAWFGGVKFEWLAEGAAIPETEPMFAQYTLRGIALGGTTRIPNPMFGSAGFSDTIRAMMAEAMRSYMDYWFIRGDGAGKPLGVLNAPATVEVNRATASQFKPEDAAKMLSRHRRAGARSTVWLMHPTVIPQLMQFAVANTPVWAANWQEGTAGTLLGYPVIITEYVPALGTRGDVALVDWSAYAVQLADDIEVAVSEHAFFTNDQTALRVIAYADGQPRVRDRAKLVGTSTEVSPFVVLN